MKAINTSVYSALKKLSLLPSFHKHLSVGSWRNRNAPEITPALMDLTIWWETQTCPPIIECLIEVSRWESREGVQGRQ